MDDEVQEKKPKKRHRFMKFLLMLVLILLLIIGGFALGIYLRLFNAQDAGEKLGLSGLPVVGQFFSRPAEQEDMNNAPVEDVKPEPDQDENTQKIKVTRQEIEEQMKKRQEEERKRVSKLAKLYNEMKPKDAAEALDQLDDDLCIEILQKMDQGQAARVLSFFQPSKTARLTKIMYEGKKKTMTSPEDLQKMMQQGQQDQQNQQQ
jgi:flagellar protein FlbB